MKATLRKMLRKVGLEGSALVLYSMRRAVRPAVFFKELRYRLLGAPDGLPLPPPGLVYSVIATGLASEYFESGKDLMLRFMSCVRKSDDDPADFGRILDFGCGVGRLIRHLFSLEAELHGTDCNGELIEWCRKRLPRAEFRCNERHPPLEYDNDYFDFVYAASVLTHLDEPGQAEWMADLRRVLKPGGILLFTVHGTKYVAGLPEDKRAQYVVGKLATAGEGITGSNRFGSYESPEYVTRRLLVGFDLVSFTAGENNNRLSQDVYTVRKAG